MTGPLDGTRAPRLDEAADRLGPASSSTPRWSRALAHARRRAERA